MKLIPKDSMSAAFNMWSHVLKVMENCVKNNKEDEAVLEDIYIFMVDGDYIKANNIMYGLSDTQIGLIPPMVKMFLNSYANKTYLEHMDDISDSDV